MTVTVKFRTVLDSIAAIDIPGVYNLSLDEIPSNAMNTLPCLFPAPDNLITDVTFARVTMGASGTAAMDFSYTLNYRYLHSVVGSGGGLLASYSGLIENIAAILAKVFSNDAPDGSIDVTLQSVSGIGPMFDPSQSAQYHGVDIALRVMEFAQ